MYFRDMNFCLAKKMYDVLIPLIYIHHNVDILPCILASNILA